MAAPCSIWRQKYLILRCGKSWTRCVASLSQSSGKKQPPSKPHEYEERLATKKKIDKILEDMYTKPVRNTEQEYYKTHLNPDWEGHKRSVFESRFFSKKHGISEEFKSWLYWDININDNLSLEALMKRKEYIELKKDQRYLTERTQAVGRELGAAHFIVARGGAVKFTSRDIWFARNKKGQYSLPRVKVDDLFLEGIDASNTKLTYVAFDNLEGLEKLCFLRLNNCPHIDDWCLSRLNRLQDSLEFLHLSDLPLVTDCGLISLHKLHNLKCLKVSNLPNVRHLGLIALLLEEKLPGLQVLGVSEEDLHPPPWSHRGEQRLVRALLGLTEEEKEEPDFREIGNIENVDVKRYARKVDIE